MKIAFTRKLAMEALKKVKSDDIQSRKGTPEREPLTDRQEKKETNIAK